MNAHRNPVDWHRELDETGDWHLVLFEITVYIIMIWGVLASSGSPLMHVS